MLDVTTFDNDPHDYSSFINFALFAKEHNAEGMVNINGFIENTWQRYVRVVYCKRKFKER